MEALRNNIYNDPYCALIDLIKAANTNLFGAKFEDSPLASKPHATLKFEDKNIWFFNSVFMQGQLKNYSPSRIQLLYSPQPCSDFVRLYGMAELLITPERKKVVWEEWQRHFQKINTSPIITLLHFDTNKACYKLADTAAVFPLINKMLTNEM